MAAAEFLATPSVTVTVSEKWGDDAAFFRCHIAIVKDAEDEFSAIVLNLPGAGSCGASEEEAIENAKEAVAAVVESYRNDGKAIPWTTNYQVPRDVPVHWVLVNA